MRAERTETMSLKKLPELHHFTCRGDNYSSQAIIGENGGADSWTVNVKIWREPHEKTWNYRYATGELYAPKAGKVYDSADILSSGHERVGVAYKALKADLEERYA